jgi:hypothetical protein
MLSTFAVHPCVLNCPNSSGSTLFAPFRGRGILRLYQLPPLRLRTRTLTPICSKRFVRFVGTSWMMLVLTKWCTTSVVKLHPMSLPSVPSSVASFLFGIYGLPQNGGNSTLTRSRKYLAFLALPRMVPRCCVPVGITLLSRVEVVKLACAVMDPSVPLQSFASPKRMPRASISHACVCSLPCLLPWVSS